MIIQYVESSVKDTKLLYLIKSNDFPIYKDLEPYREYEFSVIQNIHETILTILLGIFDLVLNNKEELKLLKNKKEYGLSIDNFINSYQYNIDIIIQQIKLYCDYVTFFHKAHLKYLKRVHTKLRLFFTQINNDIKFEDPITEEYKCDIDKNTIESVKSMIYENDDLEIDNLLSIVGSETHTDDSEIDYYNEVVYESVIDSNYSWGLHNEITPETKIGYEENIQDPQDPPQDPEKDPEKDSTQDPEKDSTQDVDKDSTQDVDKDSPQDPDKDSTQDHEKDSPQDPEKDSTQDPEKDSTQDLDNKLKEPEKELQEIQTVIEIQKPKRGRPRKNSKIP